jgi:para-nitrobenzyl esterase
MRPILCVLNDDSPVLNKRKSEMAKKALRAAGTPHDSGARALVTRAATAMRRAAMTGAMALMSVAPTGVAPVMAADAAGAQAAPVAQTSSGKIRGYNDGPVKVFKGVPYGAPTGGANRWLPAKPPVPWSGIRDATQPGGMSPQNFGAPMAEETAMIQKGPMTEDCLNLNVFTPAVGPKSGKRPVMVWFHGGGFAGGSGNATSYDGRNLAEKHGVVLVSVTHRLNVFGFLYLGDLFGADYADSGNVGVLDLVAALNWVKNNISNFGGDPDNVTIFGQSGGGAKVSALMAMPAAKGLFKQAIAESGALVRATPRDKAAESAKRLIDALGVKTISELRSVPQDKLIATMNELHFQSAPVVDGRVLPAHPFDPSAPAMSRDVPFMVGTVETEATFFPNTPLDPIDAAKFHDLVKNSTQAPDADVDHLISVFRHANPGKDDTYLYQLLLSQTTFQERSIEIAERKADQGGAPVYVYYFTKHTPVHGGKLRAPHTLEIPYAFDSLAKSEPIIGPVTAEQQALADKVSSAWVSFARTGNPNNPKIPNWAAFDTKTRNIMIIDDQFKAVSDPLRETRLAIIELRKNFPSHFP